MAIAWKHQNANKTLGNQLGLTTAEKIKFFSNTKVNWCKRLTRSGERFPHGRLPHTQTFPVGSSSLIIWNTIPVLDQPHENLMKIDDFSPETRIKNNCIWLLWKTVNGIKIYLWMQQMYSNSKTTRSTVYLSFGQRSMISRMCQESSEHED